MGPYLNDKLFFLLIRKNLPVCIIFYIISFPLFFSSNSWYLCWVAIEINTLTFLCIIYTAPDLIKIENILNYLIIQSLRSLIIILSLRAIEINTSSLTRTPSLIILAALLLKLGVPPFHNWYIPIAFYCYYSLFILIVLIQKILPFALLIKTFTTLRIFFLTAVCIRAIIGSRGNTLQTNIKIVIIFSSISHIGWFLRRISQPILWITYFLLYSYILCSLVPYFRSMLKNMIIEKKKEIISLVTLFSLIGIPPLLGFFPKIIIIIRIGTLGIRGVLIILILRSTIDIYVYSRQSMLTWLTKSKRYFWRKKKRTHLIPTLIVTILIIGLFY